MRHVSLFLSLCCADLVDSSLQAGRVMVEDTLAQEHHWVARWLLAMPAGSGEGGLHDFTSFWFHAEGI